MENPSVLNRIIDEMELQSEEHASYLNKKTGEIITISDEEFGAVENEESLDQCPEWRREMIRRVRDVLENPDGYAQLPSNYDIHEYAIMERFCLSVEDQRISEDLLSAIRGRGAFRHFKDRIHQLDMVKAWYAFRDQAFRAVAIEWCEDHGIAYTTVED